MRRDGFVLASQHYFETQVSAAARMLPGLPPSRPQPLRLPIDLCVSVSCLCSMPVAVFVSVTMAMAVAANGCVFGCGWGASGLERVY
jgi:hypothetical protein